MGWGIACRSSAFKFTPGRAPPKVANARIIALEAARLRIGGATVAAVTAGAATAHATATAAAREAVFGNGRLAEADLTPLAGVKTILDRRAGPAKLRIGEVREGARTVIVRVLRTEVDVALAFIKRAAAKAVTAIRRQRTAERKASHRLWLRADVQCRCCVRTLAHR